MFDPTPQVLTPSPVVANPVADMLRAARALIADEKNWAVEVLKTSDNRFCARGAIQQVAGAEWQKYYFGYLPKTWNGTSGGAAHEAEIFLSKAALEVMGGHPPAALSYIAANFIVHVNNKMGHAATMAMFDRAIELAETRPDFGKPEEWRRF